MVSDKDYFVITTNVDHQFQRAGFDKKRLFYTQGDYGLFQSVNPAIQKTFDNEEQVMKAIARRKLQIEVYALMVIQEKYLRRRFFKCLQNVACPVYRCGDVSCVPEGKIFDMDQIQERLEHERRQRKKLAEQLIER